MMNAKQLNLQWGSYMHECAHIYIYICMHMLNATVKYKYIYIYIYICIAYFICEFNPGPHIPLWGTAVACGNEKLIMEID